MSASWLGHKESCIYWGGGATGYMQGGGDVNGPKITRFSEDSGDLVDYRDFRDTVGNCSCEGGGD